MTTFFIKTFGCRVNQVESQAILEQFLRAGATPADSFETASERIRGNPAACASIATIGNPS